MGILDSLRIYRGKWQVKSTDAFTADDINKVSRAEVVASEYGKAVCLHLVSGGYQYMPVSSSSKVEAPIGSNVDLTKCNCVTLGREGDDDIKRIEING